MNCSNHLSVASQGQCSACGKALCSECLYKVKSKPFCQDCIIQGAEWAPIIKGRRLSTKGPKWAAFCALIPGIGAVFNGEYLKAIAYFSVFAWLATMADHVGGIFGFAAAVFLVFTMFDAYRTAEANARKGLAFGNNPDNSESQEKAALEWGILLIVMGVLFLLIKIIPNNYIQVLWPVVFILLGAYLVYRSLQERETRGNKQAGALNAGMDSTSHKEDV
jgi:hypothetical protein